MAIANGAPNTDVPGDPNLWPIEKTKTWYGIATMASFALGPTMTYSLCVPPGDYTVVVWDRFGGFMSTFDNGIPPNTTYPWEIGNSSRTVVVPASGQATVTATTTNVNVPDGGAFYGTWMLWTYGSCGCQSDCPSGTTCAQGTCVDTAYDARNCGSVGNACVALDCCNGTCIDVQTDPNNCGTCAHACTDGGACSGNNCQ
jgi:hypothetical protein